MTPIKYTCVSNEQVKTRVKDDYLNFAETKEVWRVVFSPVVIKGRRVVLELDNEVDARPDSVGKTYTFSLEPA